MNKNIEDKYLSVIEDNVNVGKTSDLKEFGILVAGIAVLCFGLYFFAGIAADVWIDNMPNEQQAKIENVLSFGKPRAKDGVKNEKLVMLEPIKRKIISMDKNLQGKSNFPLIEYPSSDVNAFVTPDGSIYFTSGILKEVSNEEILAFVLAHELGHYAHRDHLKGIGRELIAGVILTIVTMGQSDVSAVVGQASLMSSNHYSKIQEKNADLFAGRIIQKLYGSTDGAIKFFEYLQKKEGVPEFLYYFTTHPAPSERIHLLKNLR